MSNLHKITAISKRGHIPIDDLVDGETIYSYTRGVELPVLDYEKFGATDTDYEIILSDGRKGIYNGNEPFPYYNMESGRWDTIEVPRLMKIQKEGGGHYLRRYIVNHNAHLSTNQIHTVSSDYYAAGLIITTMDRDINRVTAKKTAPYDSLEAICNKYKLNADFGIPGPYVQFRDSITGDYVNISRIFPDHDNNSLPHMVKHIMFARQFDRMEFIRGVMDAHGSIHHLDEKYGDVITIHVPFPPSGEEEHEWYNNIFRASGFMTTLLFSEPQYGARVIYGDNLTEIRDLFYTMDKKISIVEHTLKNGRISGIESSVASIDPVRTHGPNGFPTVPQHPSGRPFDVYVDSGFMPRYAKTWRPWAKKREK
jgi:hypothetical protein